MREVKREGHRGLAGDVRDRIPRIELAIEPPPLLRAALGAIQDAEPLRWTSQRRGEPGVVRLEERPDRTGGRTQLADGPDKVQGREPAAVLDDGQAVG